MQGNLSNNRLPWLSVSIRLGLSLVLGVMAALLLIGLVSADSSTIAPNAPLGDGDLDTTFGATGVVTTSIGPYWDQARGVAIQPDGKIVVAGSSNSGSSRTYYDFAVVRYTVSGELDTTFSATGVVTTPISSGDDFGRSVALQPDGKIVVVGYANNGSDDDFAVVRYTVSGALDTTFGATGIVTTPIGPGSDRAFDIAIQPDGKIVAAGFTDNGSDYDFAVARYTVSGALDTTFGASGVVTTPIGSGTEYANGIAIQPDGKIVVVGDTDNGSDYDAAVVRYTASGALDTTFGTNGVVTTPLGPDDDSANDVVIRPDGKILVVGSANNGSDDDFGLVRYTTSGALDTTFGATGIVTIPIGPGTDWVSSVAIQLDGKIVAAGYASNGSDRDVAVARYTTSGELDTTFGASGMVTTPIGPGNDLGWDIAIQPDGKIVVVGTQMWSPQDADMFVVRYQTEIHTIYLPLVLGN